MYFLFALVQYLRSPIAVLAHFGHGVPVPKWVKMSLFGCVFDWYFVHDVTNEIVCEIQTFFWILNFFLNFFSCTLHSSFVNDIDLSWSCGRVELRLTTHTWPVHWYFAFWFRGLYLHFARLTGFPRWYAQVELTSLLQSDRCSFLFTRFALTHPFFTSAMAMDQHCYLPHRFRESKNNRSDSPAIIVDSFRMEWNG